MSARREEGFTLVELLAALSILVILSVGLGASIVAGMRLNDSTRDRDLAREAARSQVEQILAWSEYESLVPQFNGATFTAGDLDPLDGNTDVGSVTIDDTDPDLVVVTVRVDWSGASNDEGFELRTEIANINSE